MGSVVDPGALTESGESCLVRLTELPSLGLPTAQLITVIGTVVEGHVSRILERLIFLSDVTSTPLGRVLLDSQLDSMDSSWESRGKWLKAAFALEYAGTAAYQDFHVLVEARNSVVHGDGALTSWQLRGKITRLLELRRAFVKKLDLTIHKRISFGTNSPDLAIQVARQFVAEFDSVVLAKYPQTRLL